MLQIIYDGDCPFCSRFVTLYRARSVVGEIELIDARTSKLPIVTELSKKFDLDKGMVVVWEDQVFYGADAVHYMSMVGSDSTVFNWFNKQLFRKRKIARALYPLMVTGRNATLKLMGRAQLGNS